MELLVGFVAAFLLMVAASYVGTNMALHSFFDDRGPETSREDDR